MNGFFNIIKREINKIKANGFIAFNLFIAPLIFSFIVIWTFSVGTLTNLPIAVLDQDNSDITRTITRAINSTPSVSVKYKVADINEGHNLIKSGKAYALVVFPHDFKKDLNRGSRPQISYYYNNQMILIGSAISKDIQGAILTSSKSVDAQIRMKQGLAKDAALTKINLIRIDERVKSNPYLNYSYFLTFANIAHIFQIFITLIAIWTLGIEFREGTTEEWLKTAENSIFVAVFGKLFLYGSIFFILMVFVYSAYILYYGSPFEGNILFCLVSTIVYIFAYQMMGLFFTAILSNLRFALSSGAFYTSLGFTFAGITFPSIAMPAFGRFYSSLLPVRPYVNLIVDQIMKGFNPKYDLIYLMWILCIGLFGFSFIPLLKKHAKDKSLCYQI